jgi:hypothetical protein
MPCDEMIITEKPIGKNSASKTTSSSGKRGLAAKEVFRFQENLGKHPYVSWGKITPFSKNVEKTGLFDAVLFRWIPKIGIIMGNIPTESAGVASNLLKARQNSTREQRSGASVRQSTR